MVALRMLDIKYLAPRRSTRSDGYNYKYGCIKNEHAAHNVVIACLPSGMPGKVSAARVIQPMKQTFPNVRIWLLVGIAGGVPRNPPTKDSLDDIHLGDVVVGWAEHTGVPSVQEYDLRRHQGPQNYQSLSILDKPDFPLLGALGNLLAGRILKDLQLHKHLARCDEDFGHPGLTNDVLFEADYRCISKDGDCRDCDPSLRVARPSRSTEELVFHQGTILTGDSVIQCAQERDFLSKKHHDAMAFEMEAAGFVDLTHGLVIRGISDYADSHKNSLWQNHAAATAGSFARELLLQIESSLEIVPPHFRDKTPGTTTEGLIRSSASKKGSRRSLMGLSERS